MDGDSDSEYRLADESFAAQLAYFKSSPDVDDLSFKTKKTWSKCYVPSAYDIECEVGFMLMNIR